MSDPIVQQFDSWDPLDGTAGVDPGMIVSAQRREISNILKSYTGYYDLFGELLQNALDAIERRASVEKSLFYDGRLRVRIDLKNHSIVVIDNGCGMDEDQFKQFLRPNISFKPDGTSRGSKGVGATYIGYGFNQLKVSTKRDGRILSGRIERGREWVDDRTGTIGRPKIVHDPKLDTAFEELDQGTFIELTLVGSNIRPKSLAWTGATTAKQWMVLLRLLTPVGGIYLCGQAPPKIGVEIEVVDPEGNVTTEALEAPSYLYPHTVIAQSADLRDFIADQKKRAEKGQDISKLPPRFTKLNGLWGEWTGAEILGDVKSDCPIRPRLDADEQALARDLGIKIYVYLAFSTDLWDALSDKTFSLRQGMRVLRGGLQLATKHMPQGMALTIPMTNNIGFQNLAHVIVHFENAEPDLGRKGFQPETVQLAEKLSVSAVTAFRQRNHLLRKPGVANIFGSEVKIQEWIREQEDREKTHSLTISGKGLFMPTEELPIRSEPIVEQDVVALFNQMLSSGLIRGVQLISSSQYKQYDGLFRVFMERPYDKYILDELNPLGIEGEMFASDPESLRTPVKVLEYKYNLDGLIEELQTEIKVVGDIGLAVAWEMGSKWSQMFEVTSLLDPENVHHRQIHGTTHRFTHSVSGAHAFDAIILKDLINVLRNPEQEVARQKKFSQFGDLG